MTASFTRQWHIVRHDKWLLACLTWLPVMLSLSIWAIFSAGIARNLPVGVVDLNHSRLSQQLVRNVNASPTMNVTQMPNDVSSAKQALIEGDIYAYLVIPVDFEKDTVKGLSPQVSAFYNSQYVLVGKLINSALTQAHATFNAQIETLSGLSQGSQTLSGAMAHAVPIQTQITPLFNLNSNYAQFLVTAIVPALWQIMMVVVTIMILAANHQHLSLESWLGPKPLRHVVTTLAPYFPIYALHGALFLAWFYGVEHWPFHGQFALVILAQWFTAIACMIMGAFFYFLTLDTARAMSFAGAFTAPSFAFMGITFPVTDMGPLAQFWRSLLPVSHYIQVQVAQSNYGADLISTLHKLIPMLGYSLPLLLISLLITWQRTKQEKAR